MHPPTLLTLLTSCVCVHSFSFPQPAFDTADLSPLTPRQTPPPDRHITDFRGWEIQSCTGENQGVMTITESQLGQCLDFPVVVRALTLNRIEDGCTIYLFDEAGCAGNAQTLSAQTACASAVSSVERWRTLVVACAGP